MGKLSEIGLDRDGVRGTAHADDVAGDLVDLAVQRLEQVDRFQEVRDAIIGVVVDEDRTQQRLLGLDIVRGLAIMRIVRMVWSDLAGSFIHRSNLSSSLETQALSQRGDEKREFGTSRGLLTVIHSLWKTPARQAAQHG